VITGADGKPLDDILTDADNVAVADFITEQVRALTADPAVSLHVTIAGGRKTMGLYIGYALSLFGRSQDRLSHVLVSPPFESLTEFFYPSPRTQVIRDRDGQPLDAKEARVHLGQIPFVRLRDGLPKRLLEGRVPFSEAVAEAQKALPPVALTLEPAKRRVIAADKAFVLQRSHFAFYWMMAERCRAGRGGVRRDDGSVGAELLEYYGRLVNRSSGTYVSALPFLWLAMDDEPGPESLRAFVERNVIALLSNFGRMPLDPPSAGWLGNASNRSLVRGSGLWNQRHVEETCHPTFLDIFEHLIART
jgi:CRISPR-associated protein NE0113 (Cas_NE0113)